MNEPCHPPQTEDGLCCKRTPDQTVRSSQLEVTNGLADGVVAASVNCVLRKRFKLANTIYSNSDKFQKWKRPPQRLRNTMVYST
jgi:hypothetical protein